MSQQILSWPVDADGNPMVIISGQASEKVPTTQYGNVNIGPVMVMLPISASLSREERILREIELQEEAQYVVARERRLLQWALDPSTKVANPANGAVATPAGDVQPESLAQDQAQPTAVEHAAAEEPKPVAADMGNQQS